MKKKILSIAIIAMSLIPFSSFAQKNTSNNSIDSNTRIEKIKGEKKGKKGDQKIKRQNNLFEGLNLTEAQKSKLDELNSKRKAAFEEQKKTAKAEREQKKEMRKEERRANDSIRMERRKADKKEYLQEVKSIIGPDQYVVFLENYYVNGNVKKVPAQFKQPMKSGKHGMAHHKGKKGDRKDGKRDGKNRNGDNMIQHS